MALTERMNSTAVRLDADLNVYATVNYLGVTGDVRLVTERECAEVLLNTEMGQAVLKASGKTAPAGAEKIYVRTDTFTTTAAAQLRTFVKQTEDGVEILRRALATGQEQLLSQETERCNGTVRECDTDIVSRYICPDGSMRISRVHTH